VNNHLPQNNLLIRTARPEDAAAIVAIINPIIESGLYTAFDTPFSVEEERRYIEQFPARGVFHVAVRAADQRIVGLRTAHRNIDIYD
jgi:L-amino acid N-acyltransferase YncA